MNCRRKTLLVADCSGSVVRAIRTIVSTWLCASLVVLASHAAQVDYFLKLDGIKGEATSAFHQDWIVVHSVHLGASHPAADPAPAFSLLTLDMPVSKATPRLMEFCASGEPIAKGRLEFIRRTNTLLLFYEIDLSDIRVHTVEGDDARHRVEMSLSQIEWTYTAYDIAGKPVSRPSVLWDISKNQGEFSEKPVFRATATRDSDGDIVLSWGATAERDYRVMAAGDVAGPYAEVQRYESDATGPASIKLPFNPDNQFFYLEEVPQKP